MNSTFTSSTASQRAAPNFENGAREFMLRQAAITHVARGGEAPLAPRNVEERREAEHVVRTAFEADVDGERSMFAFAAGSGVAFPHHGVVAIEDAGREDGAAARGSELVSLDPAAAAGFFDSRVVERPNPDALIVKSKGAACKKTDQLKRHDA